MKPTSWARHTGTQARWQARSTDRDHTRWSSVRAKAEVIPRAATGAANGSPERKSNDQENTQTEGRRRPSGAPTRHSDTTSTRNQTRRRGGQKPPKSRASRNRPKHRGRRPEDSQERATQTPSGARAHGRATAPQGCLKQSPTTS